MSANQKETWAEVTATHGEYPYPKPESVATVATVGLDGEPAIGWLMWQGDALAWLSNGGEDDFTRGINTVANFALELGVNTGLRARTVWEELITKLPIQDIELAIAGPVYKMVAGIWEANDRA